MRVVEFFLMLYLNKYLTCRLLLVNDLFRTKEAKFQCVVVMDYCCSLEPERDIHV